MCSLSLCVLCSLFSLSLSLSLLSVSLSSIALWSVVKKKPLVVRPHHFHSESENTPPMAEEHWVTSVAAYPNTDLIASGNDILYKK